MDAGVASRPSVRCPLWRLFRPLCLFVFHRTTHARRAHSLVMDDAPIVTIAPASPSMSMSTPHPGKPPPSHVRDAVRLVDADTQVAGNHAHGLKAKQSACGRWFYKPHVRGDARAVRELEFYAHMRRLATSRDSYSSGDGDSDEDTRASTISYRGVEELSAMDERTMRIRSFVETRLPACPSTRRFVCVGDGVEVEEAETETAIEGLPKETPSVGYLRLRNITYGYERPCVIDLKIGIRTWDVEHSVEYAEKRTKSELGTTHERLGFKLCGAQTYDAEGNVKRLSREECKSIRTSETLTRETLREFVRDPVTGETNDWFWPALVRQLRAESIRDLEHRLVGSSLLIVYESGKLAQSDVLGEVCVAEAKLEARYIDFCHAVPKSGKDGEEVDENFEIGMQKFEAFVASFES
jgi:1D-myo-inositol-tetrakisphosphate 5-kinase/inositol-polyphosphate multikinase